MNGKIIKHVQPHHMCVGQPNIWHWLKLINDVGTQWQCDFCGAVWEVKSSYDGLEASRSWQLTKKGGTIPKSEPSSASCECSNETTRLKKRVEILEQKASRWINI